MDSIQQRVIEIAQQIPDYVGYQAKERRRDADKLVRRQLAAKYDEQRSRLARISRQAPLDYVVELENLDQKMQRLIARLNTAPGGYAGWFDAAQIVESDLDQLTEFDAELAAGVAQLRTLLDKVGGAVKARAGVEDAIGECADLIDTLNAQFDQREQFVALGKKPSPATSQAASPLDALKTRAAPPAEYIALTTLKLKDVVSWLGSDYLVTGKISYSAPDGPFWAYLLDDVGKRHWLRVGQGEAAVLDEIRLAVPAQLPDTLAFEGQTFTRANAGTATASVEGVSGIRRGSVDFARYTADAGKRVWVEDFGTETRAMAGPVIDSSEFVVYRK